MRQLQIDDLTTVQRTILACVRAEPGRWPRSALAKLLAGSRSPRSPNLGGHPNFGRLASRGRKAITFEIDILLQQGFLALDRQNRLIPARESPQQEALSATIARRHSSKRISDVW